ncbi:hypothetical protein DERP_002224 [Dermatophagoides pteronyssinus]|uniref:Uncharacterized protein n=1 Tax=Dermatophagoides pteronyssinus TaxID=6956 RepID=A0ABQ8JH80_DERPT|nr:hypothetical protein DERP_002224 [Dermatophagoides pteronyssinus]
MIHRFDYLLMKIDYYNRRRYVRRCHEHHHHNENWLKSWLILIFTILNLKFQHRHDSIFHCHCRHRLIEAYEFFHHDHHNHYEQQQQQFQSNQQQIHFSPIISNRSNQSNIFRIGYSRLLSI